MKKQDKIFVIGHKNPDTDSICSAIAYCDITELSRIKNMFRKGRDRSTRKQNMC